MFGQYSTFHKGKRTVADLRLSADDAHGDRIAKSRKVSNNTLELTLEDGSRIIRHQDTDIVTFHPDGSITLDSGGWQTVTTKDRMNGALPAGWSVYSDRGWYVRTPEGRRPFIDGLTLDAGGGINCKAKAAVRKAALQRHRDKQLIAKAIRSLKAKGIPHDPSGDPWIVPDDKGLFPVETVREWLREDYLTHLLVAQAFHWAGYTRLPLRLGEPIPSHQVNPVRRFLKACLGVGA